MIRVYAAPSLPVIANLKSVLDANGIASVIRNEILGTVLGELRAIDCYPELWIVDDGDLERARQIVAEATATPDETAASWRCRDCGEEVEAVFGRCWNCGTERAADRPSGE
jgi:hypothetical protein